jgi:SagB-type dehydrogenase family enzyme
VRPLAEKSEVAPGSLPRSGAAPVRYHEATKLLSSPSAEAWDDSPLAERPAMGPELALPKLSPRPDASVEHAIQKRRSASLFRDRALQLPELGFVLEMAGGHPGSTGSRGVDLFLAAHRVDGLQPGFYQYRPRGASLARVRTGDLREEAIRACLGQEKAGSAAAALLMVGRIAEATARWGRRSYRELLIESGEIGQRIYLAAEAIGLAARNLAAFYDDDLNELLGFDGRRDAVLHLTVFGHGD